MGKRGPAKKPGVLEELHGNPGKRSSGAALTYDVPEEMPKHPAWLGKTAKKEWKRLAPIIFEAKVLTDADITAFAAYCASYEQWVTAEKSIQATKPDAASPPVLVYEDEKGNKKPIPEIAVANEAKKQMLTFAREFGLTPASRSNVSAVESEEAETSIMDFIRPTASTKKMKTA